MSHDLNLSPSNCMFWIIGMAPIFTFCLGMSYEHFDRRNNMNYIKKHLEVVLINDEVLDLDKICNSYEASKDSDFVKFLCKNEGNGDFILLESIRKDWIKRIINVFSYEDIKEWFPETDFESAEKKEKLIN